MQSLFLFIYTCFVKALKIATGIEIAAFTIIQRVKRTSLVEGKSKYIIYRIRAIIPNDTITTILFLIKYLKSLDKSFIKLSPINQIIILLITLIKLFIN